MFDNIKTIIAGFTGRLQNEPTLRKWFWVFVAAQVFTLIVLWYNAFMSLNFYRKMLDRFADMQGDFLPYVVTVSVALIAFFLIASITATVLDYIAKRHYKTKGHEPMFIAAIVGLIALLCLDIYANLQGVDFVAYDTTEEVIQNPLDNIDAEYQVRRENAEQEYKPAIAKHEALIARIRDIGKASTPNHDKHCKTICPYKIGTGAVHWQGVITTYGHRLIAEYQQKIDKLETEYNAELAMIREAEITKRETAKDDYARDKGRFDLSVSTKQSGHRKMVYFAYGLAILLSFVSNHYSDRAEFAIHPDKEAQFIAAYETKHDRQAAMEAARRAQYQFGNEQTKQALEVILAQMADLKGKSGGGNNGGIGFRTGGSDASEMQRLKEENERLKRDLQNSTHAKRRDPSSTKIHDKTTTTTREVHGYLITCQTCGKEAVKKRKTAKFCSDKCRIENFNARQTNGKSRLNFGT